MLDDRLSERQVEYLEFLIGFEERCGHSPTFRDIALGMGVTSKGTVSDIIDRLAKAGAVQKAEGRYRGTRTVQT